MMITKKLLGAILALVVLLGACKTQNSVPSTAISASSQEVATPASIVAEEITNSSTSNISTEIIAGNEATHENESDYMWAEESVIPIALNGDSISADNSGVTVEGSKVTVTAAGNYRISGSLLDGQIVVDTQDEEVVRLILAGVDISNDASAPVNIIHAKKVVLILADGTENKITDATSYVFDNPEIDEPNAAIFSASDLTIFGKGTLSVTGNYNDGIASKDGLIIAGGTIVVNALDDGIRGKDYLVIKEGNLTVIAQGDGLQSDNDADTSRGYIAIDSGILNVASGGDAISAQTDVIIKAGEFTLTTAGGSSNRIDPTVSSKAIKGVESVTIDGGTFFVDSVDDAIHSNKDITINGGTYEIATGDDAMHADETLTVNNGEINITSSYEGIESAEITIIDGYIHIIASDDGINVANGMDGSGAAPMMGPGGRSGSGPRQDVFSSSGNNHLYIHGGYIYLDANGDGLDVNGAIQMTDGTVIVNGPTENNNGALDYDGGFVITGGLLVAAGSAGMTMAPDLTSSQNSVLVFFSSTLQTGTLVNIQNNAGEDILSFIPTKNYQSLVLSSPDLVSGIKYQINVGGSSTGTMADGLYTAGTYTSGSNYDTFTVTSVVTQIGSGAGMGGGPRR